MATERKPWPEWAANDYYVLLGQIRQANRLAVKALEIQHKNIYLTSKLLSHISLTGQSIINRVGELELRKKGDERWPNWASQALARIEVSGKYISAGAKHGLDGIEQDNWKMVLKGINTCIDHIHRIEAALLAGPQPDCISDDLLKTLEMGKTTITNAGGRWRNR